MKAPKQANIWMWAAYSALFFMALEFLNAASPHVSPAAGGVLVQGIGGFILGAFVAGIRNWMVGRKLS